MSGNPLSYGTPSTSLAAGYQLGEMKDMSPLSSRLAFRDDSGYWLKAGVLLAWDPQFAPLLDNHKGLCIKDISSLSSAVSAFSGLTWMKQFFVGSNYVYVGGDATSASNNYAQTGTTTAAGTDLKPALTTNGLAATSADIIGNNVVVIGNSGGTNAGAAVSASGGAFANVTAFASGTDSPKFIASNKSNLMVFAKSASIQTANTIYTSTNGTSVTGRTATGAAGSVNGLYWSPCASAFLAIAGQTLNRAADGFTYSACTLPTSVSSMAAAFATLDYQSRRCASSNTSTIILLTDGRYLRTTDGVNYSVIDPQFQYANSASAGWIIHDGTRYIWCIAQAGRSQNNSVTFATSDDDGQTWQYSLSWCDSSAASGNYTYVQTNQPSVANGKMLWAVPSATASDLRLVWDVTGMTAPSSPPDKVGVVTGSTNSNYLKVAA